MADETKRQARAEVNKLVRRGEMPRPDSLPCMDCGHIVGSDGRRHEYDHYRGYDREHWLSVQPVCAKCHKQRDSAKAQQTACIRGHAFDAANTYIKPNGTRACRTCAKMHQRNRPPRGTEHWKKINDARRHKLAAYRERKRSNG